MHYTGPIYRPPVEAILGTKLLQVTVPYHANDKSINFSLKSLAQIEEDIKELRSKYDHITRIFLINSAAFNLDSQKLKSIADKIIKYIPEVHVISMYASINSIKSKTDKDLEIIKSLRINDLWIGCGTGNSEALKSINKGYTLKDAYLQLERLNQFGIRHDDAFMLGILGHGKGIQNAVDTAEFINKTSPSLVWLGTSDLFPKIKMSLDKRQGDFVPATQYEILQEELKLLELLDVQSVPFYAVHPDKSLSIQGMLPQDKGWMLQQIKSFIEKLDENLNSSPKKHSSL